MTARVLAHKLLPERDDYRLCAVFHAELPRYAVDVRLDGSLGDAKKVGDFRIATSEGHLLQRLALTLRERLAQSIGPADRAVVQRERATPGAAIHDFSFSKNLPISPEG